jgi:acyl carrier protein
MKAKLITILSEVLKNPSLKTSLNDNSNLLDDVGMDSLSLIDLVLRIEEEFHIHIDYNTLVYNDLKSISKFCDFLAKQKKIV